MTLDLLILTVYFILMLTSKSGRRLTSFVVCCWFALSFVVAELGFPASVTFPLYWLFAGVTCIFLTIRRSWLPMIGMSGMFLLQLMMTVDAFVTSESTPLHENYMWLSLLMNIFIMVSTFLYSKGLDNVSYRDFGLNINNHNGKGT